MDKEFSDGGIEAAARTLELLWGVRKQPGRGPKRGLSVERIVQAAIEIADEEGLEALSMRRVADRPRGRADHLLGLAGGGGGHVTLHLRAG